jgi:acyl carrier protein
VGSQAASTPRGSSGTGARVQDDRERASILESYIRSNLLVEPERPLDADTRLVSEGLVDSMGLVMLAAFVEERFGVRIDDADMRAGSLETIREILALVDAR